MAIKILMPSLSPTMTKGIIAKWGTNQGDKIRIGDVIADIETDKAVMEFESVDEGFMGPILYPEGSEVEVGAHIGWILENNNEIITDDTNNNDKTISSKVDADLTEVEHVIKNDSAIPNTLLGEKTSHANGRNAKSTPAARARAKELGVSIESITGSGPMGRVQEADVVKYHTNIPSQKHHNMVEMKYHGANHSLSGMQKVIADRMLKSKTEVPHFYLEMHMCIDKLQEYKNSALLIRNLKTTLTHWFILITARCLADVPQVNAGWADGAITKYDHADISLAVAIEGGLITPILRNVNSMRLSNIVDESSHLINKAKSGKLQPNEYQGGNITISNMGMFGVDSFYPIINQPQAAIIGIGNARDELFLHQNTVLQRKMLTITLSGDHRVINGADGAKFMQRFKQYVENPELIII